MAQERRLNLSEIVLLAMTRGMLGAGVGLLAAGKLNHQQRIAIGRTLAQFAYYIVLAALLVLCASAVLRGRRWGRIPCLVVQVVLVAIGVWLVAPSAQFGWGIGLILLGGITGYLLVSKPANEWINRFPLPFSGPDQ